MKKRYKEILVVVLLLISFIILTVVTSSDQALTKPDYTVFSANKKGASLLYDTLEHMGYPVKITTGYITTQTSAKDIQVIIMPNNYYNSKQHMEELARWVVKGGKLIYFSNYDDIYADGFINTINVDSFETINNGTLYRYGMGRVYMASSDTVLNETLMENGYLYGQPIADLLDSFGYDKIYFNEAYHGYAADQKFFDTLPFGLKLICYQLIIVTIAAVLYLGKRFGKPLVYYEEVEREENEYVFTLSNLYMSTGMGSAPINAYSDKFIELARKYFRFSSTPTYEQVYEYWQQEQLSGLDKLTCIIANKDNRLNTKRRNDKREFMKITSYYKDLIKILSKL